MVWKLIREPDDPIAKVRISLGTPKGMPGAAYIVFRGDPDEVIELMEEALSGAQEALKRGDYKDERGRPQG